MLDNTIFNENEMMINYKGQKYPFRYIIFEGQEVIVSTKKLDKEIFKSNNYPDQLAEYIDTHIIFFVNDNEIIQNEHYLHKVLINNIA